MDALLIVDFQNDFCPGGALAIEQGDRIAEPLNRLLDDFDLVIATRDWHPPNHGSFEGVEVDLSRWQGTDPPSIWPPHCVQDTEGAELHPALHGEKVNIVIDKGQDPHSQGYSGFQDTDLAEILRARAVKRLYVGGLATDYCVKHTVRDARRLGFDVVVLHDAIRGVEANPGDCERAIAEMKDVGATFASTHDAQRARADLPAAENRYLQLGLSEQKVRETLEQELEIAIRTERELSPHAIAHSVARVIELDHLRIAEQLDEAGVHIRGDGDERQR